VRGGGEREGQAGDVRRCGDRDPSEAEAAGSAPKPRDALDGGEASAEHEVTEGDLDELRRTEDHGGRRDGLAVARDERALRGDEGRGVVVPADDVEGRRAERFRGDDGVAGAGLAEEEAGAARDLGGR
jgi:hypothetical protein